MKKLFTVALAVALCPLASLVMPSCGKQKVMTTDESISNAVDSMRLPHVFKDSSILTRMDYTQKVLTFRIEISKEKLNAINVDSMRVHTLSNLRSDFSLRNLSIRLSRPMPPYAISASTTTIR